MNSRTLLSVLAAAAAPASLLVALSSNLPVDLAVALFTSAGLVAFALLDYSRRVPTFEPKAEILRPRFDCVRDADIETFVSGRAA